MESHGNPVKIFNIFLFFNFHLIMEYIRRICVSAFFQDVFRLDIIIENGDQKLYSQKINTAAVIIIIDYPNRNNLEIGSCF